MAEVKMDTGSSLDLPSNSYKSKEKAMKKEEKHMPKANLKGNVTIKKRGFLSKFKGSMVSEDAGNVGEYIITDIVIPTVKDLVFNSVRGALEMILYGHVSKRSDRRTPYSSISSGGYVYNGRKSQINNQPKKNSLTYFDIENILFDCKGDAEEVLDDMVTWLETYGSCPISVFYDSAQLSAPYTAENYGWKNLSDAMVRSCIDDGIQKYYIDAPQYKLINTN